MAEQNTKMTIGPVTINYPALFKARKQLNSDKLKYEVDLLISKKSQKELHAEIMKHIQAAYLAGKDSKFKGKKPNEIRDFYNPMRDGDKERDTEEYKGHWFIKAKSDQPPQVVDIKRKPVIDESEIYSGAICYVSVNFYAFSEGGGKGIAAGLNNVLKYKDGKRLSGRPSAESDFADLDIEVNEDTDDFNFGGEEDEEEYDFTG